MEQVHIQEGSAMVNPVPEPVVHAGDEMVVPGQPQRVKALEETVAV